MKTTIITILILVAAFLFLANTTISLKPFKIQLNNWLMAIGYFLILFGVFTIKYDAERKATKAAINKVQEVFDEFIKEKQIENKKRDADSL